MQPRRMLWFGAVLVGLGIFWGWFLGLQATLDVPLCQPGELWTFTAEQCRWLRWRVVGMWCVAGLGAAIFAWGVLQWWRGHRRARPRASRD